MKSSPSPTKVGNVNADWPDATATATVDNTTMCDSVGQEGSTIREGLETLSLPFPAFQVAKENSSEVKGSRKARYRRWTPRWKRLSSPSAPPPSIYQPAKALRPVTSINSRQCFTAEESPLSSVQTSTSSSPAGIGGMHRRCRMSKIQGDEEEKTRKNHCPEPPSDLNPPVLCKDHLARNEEQARDGGDGVVQRYARQFKEDIFCFVSSRAKTAAYVLCQVLYASAILPRDWGRTSSHGHSPFPGSHRPCNSTGEWHVRDGVWRESSKSGGNTDTITPTSARFLSSHGFTSSAALMVMTSPSRMDNGGGGGDAEGGSSFFAFYGSWWRQVRRTWELMRRVVKKTSQYEALKRLAAHHYPTLFARYAGVKRTRPQKYRGGKAPRRASKSMADEMLSTQHSFSDSSFSSSSFVSGASPPASPRKDIRNAKYPSSTTTKGEKKFRERSEENSAFHSPNPQTTSTGGAETPHSMVIQTLLDSLEQVFEAEDEAVLAVETLRKMLVITLVQFFLHLPVEECVEDSFLVSHLRRRRQHEVWEYLLRDLASLRCDRSPSRRYCHSAPHCSGRRRKRGRQRGGSVKMERRETQHTIDNDMLGGPCHNDNVTQEKKNGKTSGNNKDRNSIDTRGVQQNTAFRSLDSSNISSSYAYALNSVGTGRIAEKVDQQKIDHPSPKQCRLSAAQARRPHNRNNSTTSPPEENKDHNSPTRISMSNKKRSRGGEVGSKGSRRGFKETMGKCVTEPLASTSSVHGRRSGEPHFRSGKNKGTSRPSRSGDFIPFCTGDETSHTVIFLPEIIQSVTQESRSATALRLLSRCLLGLSSQRLSELLSPFHPHVSGTTAGSTNPTHHYSGLRSPTGNNRDCFSHGTDRAESITSSPLLFVDSSFTEAWYSRWRSPAMSAEEGEPRSSSGSYFPRPGPQTEEEEDGSPPTNGSENVNVVGGDDGVSYFYLIISARAIGPCFHAPPCFGNQQFTFVHCTDPVDWHKTNSDGLSRYYGHRDEEECTDEGRFGILQKPVTVLKAWGMHVVPSILLTRNQSRRSSYVSSYADKEDSPADEDYSSRTSSPPPSTAPPGATRSHQFFTLLSFHCSEFYNPDGRPHEEVDHHKREHDNTPSGWWHSHKVLSYYNEEFTLPTSNPFPLPRYTPLPPSTVALPSTGLRSLRSIPHRPLLSLTAPPASSNVLQQYAQKLDETEIATDGTGPFTEVITSLHSTSVGTCCPPCSGYPQKVFSNEDIVATPGDVIFAEELHARLRYWQLRGEPSDVSTEEGSQRADDDDHGFYNEANDGKGESYDIPPREAKNFTRARAHAHPHSSPVKPAQECFVLPLRLLSEDVGTVRLTLPTWDEDRRGLWAINEERGLSMLREALRHCSHAVVCAMRESRAHGDFHDMCHISKTSSPGFHPGVGGTTAASLPSAAGASAGGGHSLQSRVDRDTFSRDGRYTTLDDYPLPYTTLSSLLSMRDVVEDSTLATVRWLQGESPEDEEDLEQGGSNGGGGGEQEAAHQPSSLPTPPPLCTWDSRQRRVERLKSEFRLGRSSRLDVLLVHERSAKPLVAITLIPFVGVEKESIARHVIRRWPHPTSATRNSRRRTDCITRQGGGGLKMTLPERGEGGSSPAFSFSSSSGTSDEMANRDDAIEDEQSSVDELISPSVYRVSRVTPYVFPLLRYLEEEKILLVDLDRTLVDNAIQLPPPVWRLYASSGFKNPAFETFSSSIIDKDGGANGCKEEVDEVGGRFSENAKRHGNGPQTEEELCFRTFGLPRSIFHCRNPMARKWWIRQWCLDQPANSACHPCSLYFDWQGEITFRPSGTRMGTEQKENWGSENSGVVTENISVRPNMCRLLFRTAVMWGIPLVLVTKSSRTRAEAILDQVLDPLHLLFPRRSQQVITADDSFPGEEWSLPLQLERNKCFKEEGVVLQYAGGALLEPKGHSESSFYPPPPRGTRIFRSKKSASLAIYHFETPHDLSARTPSSPSSPPPFSTTRRHTSSLFGSPTFSSLGRAGLLPPRPRCVAVLDDSPQVWLDEDLGLSVAIPPYTVTRVDPRHFTTRNGYLHVLLLSALFGAKNVRCCGKVQVNGSTTAVPQCRSRHCSCMCQQVFCGGKQGEQDTTFSSSFPVSPDTETSRRGRSGQDDVSGAEVLTHKPPGCMPAINGDTRRHTSHPEDGIHASTNEEEFEVMEVENEMEYYHHSEEGRELSEIIPDQQGGSDRTSSVSYSMERVESQTDNEDIECEDESTIGSNTKQEMECPSWQEQDDSETAWSAAQDNQTPKQTRVKQKRNESSSSPKDGEVKLTELSDYRKREKRRVRRKTSPGNGLLVAQWMMRNRRQTPPTPTDFNVSNKGTSIVPLGRLEEASAEVPNGLAPPPPLPSVITDEVSSSPALVSSPDETELEVVRGGVVVNDDDNGWGTVASSSLSSLKTKPWAVDAEDVTPL